MMSEPKPNSPTAGTARIQQEIEKEEEEAEEAMDHTSTTSGTDEDEIAASPATSGNDDNEVICCDDDNGMIDEDEEVPILCEIVGAYDLAKDYEDAVDHHNNTTTNNNSGAGRSDTTTNNNNNTDAGDAIIGDRDIHPYCIVKFGSKVIHRTKEAAQEQGGRNPIWTISTRCLFQLSVTPRMLTQHDLHISIWTKQKDPLNLTTLSTSFLGQAVISSETILANCDEQRIEVDLFDDEDSETLELGSRGSITMRFRLATDTDTRFVRLFHRKERPDLLRMNSQRDLYRAIQQKPTFHETTTLIPDTLLGAATKAPRGVAPLVTEIDEAQVAGQSLVNALSSAFVYKSYYDKAGSKRFLVKPNPDPARVEATTYMTKDELVAATLSPSHRWVEAGSGKMGKLYVEILSCHGLPNVDVGEVAGNLTDSFICAVYEDTVAQTPVIDDELSPHWPPWTQRAFVFGMMHPASVLYLGVFDFDLGLSSHDPIGRIAVNISNLQRDTDYTLKYALYPSSNVTDRTSVGAITIRVRVTYTNEKEALLTALRPRPKFHVNVKKEKSFPVVQYTCFGEYGDDNEEKFDLTVTRSYVNEMMGYKKALSYCIGDTFRSLVFWKGQVKIFGILLPVHSFIFFYGGVRIVENPALAPSFFLLSVAWIMMANERLRRQHPSPYHRCHSFSHYLEILRTGKSSLAVRGINEREGAEEAEAYERRYCDRLSKDEKMAARQAALQKQLSNIGDEKIQSKKAEVISLDLLRRFAPYQGMLARYCRKLRFLKIIVTWEEGVVSFWITACFLVGGLVSLLLPWRFILLWLGRLTVWGLLGPHMKIVDMYLQSDDEDSNKLKKTLEKFNIESRTARTRKQDALKLKDIRSMRFGPYITLVPEFNLSRWHDRPLPTSFAVVHSRKMAPPNLAKDWIPGQQLFRDMIPRTEIEVSVLEKQLPSLQKRRHALERRVKIIQRSENSSLLKKLARSFEDEDLPAAIGFELITLDEPSDAHAGSQLKLDQASSLQLVASPGVAVLQNRRTSLAATASQRRRMSSVRFDYEVLSMDDDEEEENGRTFQVGDSIHSRLEMISENRLAILETEEPRSDKRKLASKHDGRGTIQKPVFSSTSNSSATNNIWKCPPADTGNYPELNEAVEIILWTASRSSEMVDDRGRAIPHTGNTNETADLCGDVGGDELDSMSTIFVRYQPRPGPGRPSIIVV